MSSIKKPAVPIAPPLPSPAVLRSAPVAPPLPASRSVNQDRVSPTQNRVPLTQNQAPLTQDRANLMQSIRDTGGFASSGLRSIGKPSATSTISKSSTGSFVRSPEARANKENVAKDDGSKAYDYRGELAIQLEKRRRG